MSRSGRAPAQSSPAATSMGGAEDAWRRPWRGGQGFHYSETNYFLLGMIAERVTGMRVADAIDEWILEPPGLTGTNLPTTPSMAEPFSHGYSPTPGSGPEDITRANPDVTWRAGAMLSNLHDLH